MSSRRRLRVSIICVAASAPSKATPANIRNTDEIPCETIMSPDGWSAPRFAYDLKFSLDGGAQHGIVS